MMTMMYLIITYVCDIFVIRNTSLIYVLWHRWKLWCWIQETFSVSIERSQKMMYRGWYRCFPDLYLLLAFVDNTFFMAYKFCTFSALTLLVGWQEGHPACKDWVVRYWHSYLSGARCKWFAYGPADDTATLSSLAAVKSRMVCLSGGSLPRLSWKKVVKRM